MVERIVELNWQALAAEVMDRCAQLACISAVPDNISRFYLTDEHRRCNALVAEWMVQAGMHSWQDAAGNICGRYEGLTPGARALVLGSHLDTVPNAGAYDGIAGVLLAIAAVAQLNAQKIRLPVAIEVVGFGDEEGVRFGRTLLGSRAFAGSWDNSWFDLQDKAGVSLRQAFVDFGLNPDDIGRAARTSEELVAYFEVHIEQGPVLEQENLALGIVTSIAGARRFQVAIKGMAGHAGTVPMALRRDALVGAAEAVLLIEKVARGRALVATVGQLACYPGAVNVIPGEVMLSLDVRAADDSQRDAALDEIRQLLGELCDERQLDIHWTQIHAAPAAICSPYLQQLQAQVLEAMELPAFHLMSGAGHDAMALAELTRVAMYFVRCKGGISHHPQESVTTADVALALEALVRSLQAFT